MSEKRKLLAVLAHPDDESLGFGGVLAKYAAERVETYLVTATRGERGRFGTKGKGCDPAEVGRVREQELREAADVLGIRDVSVLGFPDGGVDQVDPATAVRAIAAHVRRIRPAVVITFGPDGAYGHPDHIAISQFTTAALVCAADASYECGEDASAPHRTAKHYYMAWRRKTLDLYEGTFRKLKSTIDGVDREAAPWADWVVTTEVDASDHWQVVWRAVQCHKTQMAIFGQLDQLSDEHHRKLWGAQEFYRVFSSVNGGRRPESDLFAGLR